MTFKVKVTRIFTEFHLCTQCYNLEIEVYYLSLTQKKMPVWMKKLIIAQRCIRHGSTTYLIATISECLQTGQGRDRIRLIYD